MIGEHPHLAGECFPRRSAPRNPRAQQPTMVSIQLVEEMKEVIPQSLLTAGKAQLQVSFITDGPMQLSSPNSSAYAGYFLGHTSVGSLQSRGSFSDGSALLLRSTLDLQISSFTLIRGYVDTSECFTAHS